MVTLVRAAACAALLAAGCRGGPAERARAAPSQAADAGPARAAPLAALELDGGEAARRLGSFSWSGAVSWSVTKPGGATVRAKEEHRVRQLASGDLEVTSQVDPGSGPGSVTGKSIVLARGMTYARGRWAPWRERPTDRGEGARAFRDQSFRMAGDLAQLYGPALALSPSGERTVLGRRATRFVLSLSGDAPREAPPPPGLPDGGYDPDTRRHVDFLEGRVPTALEGELLVDAQTGVPLAVRMRGAFSERADPQLRAEVELSARIVALGAAVPAVVAPEGALPDERKPKGVARALEAAGLRKRAGADAGSPETEDDEER